MPTDIFDSVQAHKVLDGKTILIFGDSNIRAIYKDLLWLLEEGSLIPIEYLKIKNEPSFLSDIRTSTSRLMNSRNYRETREYKSNVS